MNYLGVNIQVVHFFDNSFNFGDMLFAEQVAWKIALS